MTVEAYRAPPGRTPDREMSDTTNERQELAMKAFDEAGAILSIIGRLEDEDDLPALRCLVLRCSDLLGVMYGGVDEDFATIEEMKDRLFRYRRRKVA